MTTFHQTQLQCAACGRTSAHAVLMSTNAMGPPDLDLRPAPMMRDTMHLWLQECPGCGLVAAQLDEAPADALRLVGEPEYQELRACAQLPALARRFLCAALLSERRGEPGEAAGYALRAAWVCDDADSWSLARDCRRRALELFERARADEGADDDREPGAQEALMADVARRGGRPERARAWIRAGLGRHPEPIVARVLRFQAELLERGDLDCHSLGELPGGE